MNGLLTPHLDAVQLLIAAFFLFFLGLVFYLRREDKREGYPLQDDIAPFAIREGFPAPPPPKTYALLDGGTTQLPHITPDAPVNAVLLDRFPGAPLVPVGDPMLASVGPGAYPLRKDEPFMAFGHPQLRPLRLATDWHVAPGDVDPRGFAVLDRRGAPCGMVHDLWVDRGVRILRYIEVAVTPGHRILLPIYYATVKRPRYGRAGLVRLHGLLAAEFHRVPVMADPDMLTAREEDRINAYYAGAALFAGGRMGGLLLPDTPELPA